MVSVVLDADPSAVLRTCLERAADVAVVRVPVDVLRRRVLRQYCTAGISKGAGAADDAVHLVASGPEELGQACVEHSRNIGAVLAGDEGFWVTGFVNLCRSAWPQPAEDRRSPGRCLY